MPERVGVHYSWENSAETNRKILSSHLLQLFRLLFCGQLLLRRTSHFQVTSCIITIWNRFFAILSDCHHHCLFGCSYSRLYQKQGQQQMLRWWTWSTGPSWTPWRSLSLFSCLWLHCSALSGNNHDSHHHLRCRGLRGQVSYRLVLQLNTTLAIQCNSRNLLKYLWLIRLEALQNIFARTPVWLTHTDSLLLCCIDI